MLDGWLSDLTKELEMPENLPRNDKGAYIVTFDDINVEIASILGGCAFFTTLAAAPKQNPGEFYTQAMTGNLFGRGTDGAVLALSDDYNTFILTRQCPEIQNSREFRDKLEDFVNSSDFWISEIQAFNEKTN